ncbi:uncharacterized protein TOT_010000743 [Theileria orientalis strain Shintoku]|uniref:tRNA (adenine(58)-N(1))-methyltransferase non-catalytic subunit TRM6 n=1 Tax=Theileria orientalis strain Shintoku TaxID=869250 RepID=J4DNN8_THEOR|nr:uncharacterized protein TOT_010000743 [Theileria orientalis strain Shintoku]BAM39284.1 uncharacterized protein TOT_010000743 [Theileria orientalis strain Shintoku]|eukprot:XP_009689585.1 uncharacterized protein TOT_010000743 [Theileria orientalis strain Shintoku]
MEYRFSYDPSQPIRENDHVLLMDHIKRCFVIKVERNKFVKICKDKFKIDTIIGLNYGVIFTKVDNEWIKVDRRDDRHGSYWDLLESEYQDQEDADSAPSKDFRSIADDTRSQKLTADDINEMKKNVNASELITAIVQNSETFQSRTSMSKEKYIRRKEFRQQCLRRYMRFESLGMMLHSANVQQGHRSIVFDHSLGLITGAIAQRLQGTGKIYRLVTKGVSDKIVHELGVNYYDNILSVDYEQVIRYCGGQELVKSGEPSDTGRDEADADQPATVVNEQESQSNTEDADADPDADADVDSEQPVKRRKKDTLPGIYPLSNATESDLEQVDLVIGNVSFNKCGKNNPLVNQYTASLMKIADRFLKNDGRLVMFGQHFQPLSQCYATMTRSSQYVNVRLDETFLREFQVLSPILLSLQIKPMCTHPVITKCRPCCGFILSAIKISGEGPV